MAVFVFFFVLNILKATKLNETIMKYIKTKKVARNLRPFSIYDLL